MQITALRQLVGPMDRDKDRISNMEQPLRDVVDIKKRAAKETDKAAKSDRMP